jgi:hypothetical protein
MSLVCIMNYTLLVYSCMQPREGIRLWVTEQYITHGNVQMSLLIEMGGTGASVLHGQPLFLKLCGSRSVASKTWIGGVAGTGSIGFELVAGVSGGF